MKIKQLIIIIAVIGISIGSWALSHKDPKRATSNDKHATSISDDDDEKPLADNPWEQLQKIREQYLPAKGVTYTGTIILKDLNGEMDKEIERLPFSSTIVGKDFDYSIGPQHIISKKNIILVVDDEGKSVIVNHNSNNNPANSIFSIEQFKTLLEGKKGEAIVSSSKAEKVISIDRFEDPAIQGYKIYYDSSSYAIHKIEIAMLRYSPLENDHQKDPGDASNGKSRSGLQTYTYFIELNFLTRDLLNINREDFNPQNRYIHLSGAKIDLSPAYHDYNLAGNGE
jgi:hypothetical protein